MHIDLAFLRRKEEQMELMQRRHNRLLQEEAMRKLELMKVSLSLLFVINRQQRKI